jgi:hypothetical protein
MRNWATPVVGYVGAVIAVIALATLAGLHLRGSVNRAHRHWDAGVGRVIAQKQERRREMGSAALVSTASAAEAADRTRGKQPDNEPAIDEIAAGSMDGKAALAKEEEDVSKKAEDETRKKPSRRAQRKQQAAHATAFTNLPHLAVTAATATTSALIPFR